MNKKIAGSAGMPLSDHCFVDLGLPSDRFQVALGWFWVHWCPTSSYFGILFKSLSDYFVVACIRTVFCAAGGVTFQSPPHCILVGLGQFSPGFSGPKFSHNVSIKSCESCLQLACENSLKAVLKPPEISPKVGRKWSVDQARQRVNSDSVGCSGLDWIMI